MSHYSSSTNSSTKSPATSAGRVSTRSQAQTHSPRSDLTDDILSLVDQHLAWQAESSSCEQARRGSAGTLIVDWDGVSQGRAFHREPHALSSPRSTSSTCTDSPSPRQPNAAPSESPRPANTRQDSTQAHFHRPRPRTRLVPEISVTYSPTHNVAHGSAPRSHMRYAYNGRVFRVARYPFSSFSPSPSSSSSSSSSPSAASPSQSRSRTHIQTHDFHIPLGKCDKVLPPLPLAFQGDEDDDEEEAHSSTKVRGFVLRVLRRLEGLGVLGRMRREREGRRKSMSVSVSASV